jgi:hypothetical protein
MTTRWLEGWSRWTIESVGDSRIFGLDEVKWDARNWLSSG